MSKINMISSKEFRMQSLCKKLTKIMNLIELKTIFVGTMQLLFRKP